MIKETNNTITEEIAELTYEERIQKLKGIITSKCNYQLKEEQVDEIVKQLNPNVIYQIVPVFTIPYMLKMLTNRFTIYDRMDKQMKYGTIDKSKVLLGECEFGVFDGTFKYTKDGKEENKQVKRTKCKFNGKHVLATEKTINKWTIMYKNDTMPVSNSKEEKHVIYIYLPKEE